MKGLKFWVMAFCWLDSTVSTAELPPELEAFVALTVELLCELPPQAASSAAVPRTAQAASRRCRLIRRFIAENTSLSAKRLVSRMWTIQVPGAAQDSCRVCGRSRAPG